MPNFSFIAYLCHHLYPSLFYHVSLVSTFYFLSFFLSFLMSLSCLSICLNSGNAFFQQFFPANSLASRGVWMIRLSNQISFASIIYFFEVSLIKSIIFFISSGVTVLALFPQLVFS